MGSASFSVAASPPIMKTSSPFFAPQSPPVTGAAFGAGSGNLAREGGRNGTGVGVDGAALESGQRTLRAPENFFEGGWIADHGEKKIRGSGDFLRGFCEYGARRDEFIGT